MILYCRRCDLGFCEKHLDQHVKEEEHELVRNLDVGFCCVCMGIYRPKAKEEVAS